MPVRLTLEGPVARITLANSARRNAISLPMLEAFHAALDSAFESPCRVLLLDAEGKSFCAGDDLDEFASLPLTPEFAAHFVARLQGVTTRLMFGPWPLVCAVQGHAVGGGAAWPLNADVTLVSDRATLFCPELRYGLFPTGGLTLLLPECAGPKLADEVLLLGRRLDAAAMVAHGLATRLTPAETLAAEAMAAAQTIAALSPAAVAAHRQSRQQAIRPALEAAMARESTACIAAALDPEIRERVARLFQATQASRQS